MPPKQSKDPKPKSRVAVRLKEAVGASKARNRSADLVKLKDQFYAFVKKLKGLIIVLKTHHGSMIELQKTRLAVGFVFRWLCWLVCPSLRLASVAS